MIETKKRPATVADRIALARERSGLSQREVAARCRGLTAAYVSRLERGERQPSIRALRQIAGAVGCSVSWLETGSELGGRLGALIARVELELVHLEDHVATVCERVRVVIAEVEVLAAGEHNSARDDGDGAGRRRGGRRELVDELVTAIRSDAR